MSTKNGGTDNGDSSQTDPPEGRQDRREDRSQDGAQGRKKEGEVSKAEPMNQIEQTAVIEKLQEDLYRLEYRSDCDGDAFYGVEKRVEGLEQLPVRINEQVKRLDEMEVVLTDLQCIDDNLTKPEAIEELVDGYRSVEEHIESHDRRITEAEKRLHRLEAQMSVIRESWSAMP